MKSICITFSFLLPPSGSDLSPKCLLWIRNGPSDCAGAAADKRQCRVCPQGIFVLPYIIVSFHPSWKTKMNELGPISLFIIGNTFHGIIWFRRNTGMYKSLVQRTNYLSRDFSLRLTCPGSKIFLPMWRQSWHRCPPSGRITGDYHFTFALSSIFWSFALLFGLFFLVQVTLNLNGLPHCAGWSLRLCVTAPLDTLSVDPTYSTTGSSVTMSVSGVRSGSGAGVGCCWPVNELRC